MLAVLSAIVALACVLASVRRLVWAVAPTSLDADLLLKALEGDGARARWDRLRRALTSPPWPTWERDLCDALGERDARLRDARVGEQLGELDWRAQRWARVPRVCASIATSAGFLFASIAMLRGLAAPVEDGVGPDAGAAMVSALNALTLGIAGTAFCVAVHLRTRRVVRRRLAADERLIVRLQALMAQASERG
jgi:hypothetical protein